ncbi:Uncharacterised protein [Raoultella ornithinolytica]|nr:Uncharacterised protein [Raoultella ornithinolytica]
MEGTLTPLPKRERKVARGAPLFIRARGQQGYQQGGTMLNYVIKRLLG